MELKDSLQPDVFRQFVVLVAPGAVAITPTVVRFYLVSPQVRAFIKDESSLAAFLLLIGWVSAGMVLEDLGAFIEARLWDRRIARKNDQFYDDWWRYLALKTSNEVVGQRYLRTLLTRMKFELSMAPALLLAYLTTLWIDRERPLFMGVASAAVFVVVTVLVISYLFAESYNSARALADMRGVVIGACSDRRDGFE